MAGALRHLRDDDKDALTVDLISDEALKTSEIEGEYLKRAIVHPGQSWARYPRALIQPAERGIADMMMDLYRTFAETLRRCGRLTLDQTD